VSNAETQVTIATDEIRVTVSPHVGGTITEIRHKESGLSVMGRVPWVAVDAPLPSPGARDEPEWLTRYTGGWPLLFPNAGDACTVDGVFHGFHGEASITPWEVADSSDGAVVLEPSCASIPAFMRRAISVGGEVLTMRETVSFSGEGHVDGLCALHAKRF